MQTSPSDGMYTSSSYETRKPPPDKLQFFPPLDEIDEANFLKQGSDTGEHIRTRLPRTDANHLF